MPVGLMAVEITLQEFNSRSGARAYLEVLSNAPPRRARGKLSKRTARIRVRLALMCESSIPRAKYQVQNAKR